MPSPRYKGLRIALSIELSNAESPTVMHIVIPIHCHIGDIHIPMGVLFVALF